MRRLSLSFILFFLVAAPVTSFGEDFPVANEKNETSSSEIPGVVIDEALTALILGDEGLCCRVSRTDPRLGELVWGPLYWWRLKIICPKIRPVAIC